MRSKDFEEVQKRIEWLEQQAPVVYWIAFSNKSLAEQERIKNEYEKHLEGAKGSLMGQLYESTINAMREGKTSTVISNANLAKQMLADGDYEETEPYDPKFIANHSLVKEYRELKNENPFSNLM